MLMIPENLSDTRILVTNDDGIHAPGIAVLTRIAQSLSNDVWVVAPETEQSGAGHSLTLHQPLRTEKLDERRYTVSGTPTDSVLLAVKEIIPDDKPLGLILSGINRGVNIAEDITYSGTIAAAMEGTLLDIPSIALSHEIKPDADVLWETAEHYAALVLSSLSGFQWPKGNFISINTPHLPVDEVKGVHLATQGRRKIAEKLDGRIDPKGRPYYWIGGVGFEKDDLMPGTDHTLLHEGYVTVTPLCMDLTNDRMLTMMSDHMKAIL